jgi:hypothetical protein
MAKYRAEVLKKVKDDADLFAAVAKELGIKPVSLPQLIDRNSPSLYQYSVVKIIADFEKCDSEDLFEEDTVGADTEVKTDTHSK